LVHYVEQTTGQTDRAFGAAQSAFRGLSLAQQLPLIKSVFYNQLVVSGQQANQVPSLGFGLGYNAIDSLFPGSRAQARHTAANLTVGLQPYLHAQRGSLNIPGAGGDIDVGLANPPTNFSIYGVQRQPSDLGIVAGARGT